MTTLSSYATAGKRRGLFDPSELTSSQRQWLRRLASYKYYRRKGGYRMIGEPGLCTLATAHQLYRLGLIRYEAGGNGTPYIELSGLGRQLLAIMEQRQGRKA